MTTNVRNFAFGAPKPMVQSPAPAMPAMPPMPAMPAMAPVAPVVAPATATGFGAYVPSVPSMASLQEKGAQAYNAVKTSLDGKSGIVIAFFIIMLAFAFVIIFILREMKGNAYKKGTLLTNEVVKLSEVERPVEVPGSSIPTKQMGNQMSYSFWMYVNNFTQSPDVHKIVFYRGEKNSIQTANPIVMMDGVANKLHFVIKTRDSSLASTDASISYNKLKPIVERNYFANPQLRWVDNDVNRHLIMTINNVPFSRWVHYTISINDNVVTLFQDGQIYAVKTVGDFMQSRPQDVDVRGNAVKYNLMIDESAGSMYIGKNSAIANGTSVDGHLSKMQAFNYAMNSSDVQNVYKEGPFTASILRNLGMTGYGVRTPIYKMQL
jgi:hypothetical protein